MRFILTRTLRLGCVALLLAGCAIERPDARDTISRAAREAPYPQLEPLDALLARAEAGSTVADETEILAARLAALKQRANALKGRSIVDGASRLKLLQASARNAARLSQ